MSPPLSDFLGLAAVGGGAYSGVSWAGGGRIVKVIGDEGGKRFDEVKPPVT